MEISYISDFITSIHYNKNFSDSWGTFTIFHDGTKVDSVYHSAGFYVVESYEQISHFTHLDHFIREVTSTYYEYSQRSRIDTNIWYLTDNGNIESKGDVEYTYDNKLSPFANSFYQYSPTLNSK